MKVFAISILLAALPALGSGTAFAISAGKTHHVTAHARIVTDPKTVGRYTPRSITIHVGDRVVFKNQSNAPHTVSADNGKFDSGTINMGKSWTFTARKAGTYTYFCQFHPGMHGKLIVKA